MKVNLNNEIEKEIQDLIDKLCENGSYKQVDECIIEVDLPFVVNPNSKSDDWKKRIYVIFYHELLSYRANYFDEDPTKTYRKRDFVDFITPWICCRIELEGRRSIEDERRVCDSYVKNLKKIGYSPFTDEDASHLHWRRTEQNGWVKLECFVNPDYPNGWWENHVLD